MEKGRQLPRPARGRVGNVGVLAVPVAQRAQHLPHCFRKGGEGNDDQAVETVRCKVQLNVFAGKLLQMG